MDHRTTAREPVELPATIAINGAVLDCSVHNVSLGGVFVNGVSLPIDTRVVLRFSVPRNPLIEAECIVRWSTEEGVGLQFEGLRAHDTYALTQYLRSQTRPTARTAISDIIARTERS
jgi:PilZ domain